MEMRSRERGARATTFPADGRPAITGVIMSRFVWSFFCVVAVASAAFSQTPAPALLVLNKAANELAIVDPAALKVVARVAVGEAPHEVCSDGKLAVVGNYGTGPRPGNTLSVIDLASQKELKRVDLGALRRPHGIVCSGGKAWFTAEGNKLIGRLDPASGAVDWLMGTGQNSTHMLVLTRDESKIFTANIGSDSITCLENAGNRGWQATVIAVGKGPEAIDLSPDGREVWTAHSQDGGVSIIDVETKKVNQTLAALTRHSNRLKFTPDGKRVLISDAEGGEVVVLDAETRKEVKRIKTGGQPLGIQMQPDGARAYVALAQEGAVAVIDLKTLEISGKVATGPQADGLAWAGK